MPRRDSLRCDRLPKGARFATTVGSALGFVAALAAAPNLPSRAAIGQLPGYAAEQGFDPRRDVLRLLVFALFPLIGGAAGMWLSARMSKRGARAAPGSGGEGRAVPRARPGFLLPAVAAHALTVWIFLVPVLVPRGAPPVPLLALLAAISFTLARVLGEGDSERGAAYLAAACPILPLALLGERPPVVWLAAGVGGLLLPPLARAITIVRPNVVRPLRALALVVLLPGSVTALAAASLFRAPGVADVFEDGHGLLPASEYLRGELPYRDIVPGHGLVTDGLFQAMQLRLFGDDYRGLKRGTKLFGSLFLPAFYALGFAATGSPAVGFAGLVFSFLFCPQYVFLRALLSIWTLALALYASRTKKAGAWLACGAALPVNLCVAVDFAAYAAAGVAVALWIARGNRFAHLRRLVLGGLASGAAIAIVLGSLGSLGGFVRTTFFFVPSLLPAYAMGFPPFVVPRDLESVLRQANGVGLLYGFAASGVVLLGALLPRAPRVGARARAMLPLFAWVVLAMLSVLERNHLEYALFCVPVGLILLQRWVRGWRPWTSPRAMASGTLLAALVLTRGPASLVAILADRIVQPPTAPTTRTFDEPLRARGALFAPWDARLIEATSEVIRHSGLRENETWFDFASAPGLYFLFDRDCPIRYYEVSFFESESAQREVIAAIERNPRVRLALVRSGLSAESIDGMSSAARAPHVDTFLRARFRPFYRAGDVEFWTRKEGPIAGRPGPAGSNPP